MATRVPPKSTSGVFFVTATVLIDAPLDTVWNILCDFNSYIEWNPFARRQIIVDSFSPRKVSVDQTPVAGKLLLMDPVHIPATMGEPNKLMQRQVTKERIIFAQDYQLAWEYIGFPKLLLHAERWQTLKVGELDGKPCTKYETIEVFRGVLAYVVRFLFLKDLDDSFQMQGDALKKRAEAETKSKISDRIPPTSEA
ncbi:hypothetical protein DL96DRAFT_1571864 [Flagelloscypha sp. PMI_526]|nr:hypothetical protein DL96DRAFT_1571864 [Flagelloscypha sp. PMI_526]